MTPGSRIAEEVTPNMNENAQLAMMFGSGLLAARLGLTGYQGALEALQSMTLTSRCCVVRQGSDQGPHTLASSVPHDLDPQAFENELIQIFQAGTAKRSAPWSVSTKNGRLWVLPLGQTGQHDYSIVLLSNPSVLAESYHDIGARARQCWQLPDQTSSKETERDTVLVEGHALGPDNPYHLTNAERLVCEHLRAGARPIAIAEASGKSIATIRTHLARIYSKTDCAGMVEVLHLLGTSSPTQTPQVPHAA